MNKYEASIPIALIEAGRPWLGLFAQLINKIPPKTTVGTLAALGASFRWHDAVWRVLS